MKEANLPRKKARLLPRATKPSTDQTCLLPYGHHKRLKEKNEVRTLTYRAEHECKAGSKLQSAGNGGRRARGEEEELEPGRKELWSRKKKNSKLEEEELLVAEEEFEPLGGKAFLFKKI